uniref:Uncharacterized protein n=1 Tax=Romanomermis culicivorax TaxID=13658 RepID=A0A915HTA7_ROMCU
MTKKYKGYCTHPKKLVQTEECMAKKVRSCKLILLPAASITPIQKTARARIGTSTASMTSEESSMDSSRHI